MPSGINKKTGKSSAYGVRNTVEQRKKKRDSLNIKAGRQPGWTEEALDYFLAGIPVPEIIEAMGVSRHSFYNGIAKAALYRLMIQHQAERLEEIPELKAEENK